MEVEIKAICHNLVEIEAILRERGATVMENSHQVDVYLDAPNRDLRQTNEYLRLRFLSGDKRGIFAYHRNLSDGVTKECEVEISNLRLLKRILSALGFKPLGKIDKKRITYELGNYKISLDDIKGIGKFIEVETECGEKEAPGGRNLCIGVLESLGISRENLVNFWLSDIAIGKSKLPVCSTSIQAKTTTNLSSIWDRGL